MFIKFPSIDNHYQQGAINRWIKRFPELTLEKFIVTEKIDGSNLQLIITEDKIEVASRRHMLSITSSFFDYQRTVLVNEKDRLEKIQDYIKYNDDIEVIHIYGEIFGEGVQKRIHYIKDKKFKPFEVRINGNLISISDAIHLFLDHIDIGMWWVPIVKIADSFDEAMETEVSNIKTQIDDNGVEKGLNRNIEGVVIAPYNKVYAYDQYEDGILTGQSVFRLKKKCKEFNDKMKVKTKEYKPFKGSDEYVRLQNIWNGYFNDNRLQDLFSKEGRISEMGEIGKFIKLMTQDVREDFLNDHKEEFILLNDKEKKKIMSSAGQNTVPLLKAELQKG